MVHEEEGDSICSLCFKRREKEGRERERREEGERGREGGERGRERGRREGGWREGGEREEGEREEGERGREEGERREGERGREEGGWEGKVSCDVTVVCEHSVLYGPAVLLSCTAGGLFLLFCW